MCESITHIWKLDFTCKASILPDVSMYLWSLCVGVPILCWWVRSAAATNSKHLRCSCVLSSSTWLPNSHLYQWEGFHQWNLQILQKHYGGEIFLVCNTTIIFVSLIWVKGGLCSHTWTCWGTLESSEIACSYSLLSSTFLWLDQQ